MIEAWFTNGGRCYDCEAYEQWEKATAEWKRLDDPKHLVSCRKQCNCEPTPNKPDKKEYFLGEPKQRLLSEVCAATLPMDQIDDLSKHQVATWKVGKEEMDETKVKEEIADKSMVKVEEAINKLIKKEEAATTKVKKEETDATNIKEEEAETTKVEKEVAGETKDRKE